MNKEDAVRLVEEVEAKLAEAKKLLKEAEEGRWKPVDGEMYYYIGLKGRVYSTNNDLMPSDQLLIKNGNCFKTEEEAESSTLYHILNSDYYYKLPGVPCHLDKVPEDAEVSCSSRWYKAARVGKSFSTDSIYRWRK